MTSTKYATRPAKRLIQATSKCSTSAEAYGQCILLHYQDLKKGICEAEFVAFKQCVGKNLR